MPARQPIEILAAFASLVLICGSLEAQEYRIRLSQADKVGHKYTISSTARGKVSNKIDAPGLNIPPQEQAFTFGLDGTVEVKAVDEKSGQPTKLACTVAKCVRDNQPLADAGTMMTAENIGGKTEVSAPGKQFDPQTAEALGRILQTHKPGEPSEDDAIFGTDKPRKVGDSWPVNSDAAAQSFSKQGLPVTKDQIKGTVKLVDVKTVEGKQYLHVEAEFNIDNLHGQVNQQTIDSGTFTGHMSGMVPAEEGNDPLNQASSIAMTLHVKGTAPNGQEIKVETSMKEDLKVDYSPAQ